MKEYINCDDQWWFQKPCAHMLARCLKRKDQVGDNGVNSKLKPGWHSNTTWLRYPLMDTITFYPKRICYITFILTYWYHLVCNNYVFRKHALHSTAQSSPCEGLWTGWVKTPLGLSNLFREFKQLWDTFTCVGWLICPEGHVIVKQIQFNLF